MLFRQQYDNLEDKVIIEKEAGPIYETSMHKVPNIFPVNGKSKTSGKNVTVKYNQIGRNYDYHYNYVHPFAFNEDAATYFYKYFGIPCQSTELVLDKTNNKLAVDNYYGKGISKGLQTCVVVEDFLEEDEELLSYIDDPEDNHKAYNNMKECFLNSDLSTFLETMLDKTLNGKVLTDEDREKIIRDEVRKIYVSVLLGNDIWLTTLSLVHNKKDDTYKASPVYCNKWAFYIPEEYSKIRSKAMTDIYSYYPDYIEDLEKKATNLKKDYKTFAPKTNHKDSYAFGDKYYKRCFDSNYNYINAAFVELGKEKVKIKNR